MMKRRSFLAAAAAAAVAPATLLRAAEGKRRVVVVGAGLAGLSCAYELRKLGFEVVVLEGQGRAGGRVQTLREGLDPELSADAGAVQERGSGRCGAPAWTKLRGRAWPRIEVAAAIESGGATPGPQRHGGALPELALEVGKGQRGFAGRARPDPGAGSLHAAGVHGEAGAFPGCDRA